MVQEQNGMINNTRNAHDKSRSMKTTKLAYRSMDWENQRTDHELARTVTLPRTRHCMATGDIE